MPNRTTAIFFIIIVLLSATSCCTCKWRELNDSPLPGDRCAGYKIDATQSATTIKITLYKGGPDYTYDSTFTFMEKVEGSNVFLLTSGLTPSPITDRDPTATASLKRDKLCLTFGTEDSTTDPCLQHLMVGKEYCTPSLTCGKE